MEEDWIWDWAALIRAIRNNIIMINKTATYALYMHCNKLAWHYPQGWGHKKWAKITRSCVLTLPCTIIG